MGQQVRNLWLDNKAYFLTATLLLVGGAVVGFLQADMVESIAKEMMSQIKAIADRIKDSGGSSIATFWVIFKNNVLSSIYMMLFGIFFAVIPVFGLLSNGVLLGFILEKIASAGVNPLIVLVVGILPHGIFELPAVVFAAAVGIRYGLLSIRSIGSVLRIAQWGEVKREWMSAIRQLPLVLASIVVLLLVAAVVESLVTPLLLQSTIGGQFKLTE